MGKCCYIIGAGERAHTLPEPGASDLVIAADGGYAWLSDLGIKPGIVVGDFDSLGMPPAHENVVRLPREKDETDTMAALRLGREMGYRSFHIYGGTGGRFDHTMANLQLLSWLAARGEEGILHAAGWSATAVTDGAICFGKEARGLISVFAHSDEAWGVSLEGLKYTLSQAVLKNDFALGVSNEFTGAGSRIAVERGTLLVVWEQGAFRPGREYRGASGFA